MVEKHLSSIGEEGIIRTMEIQIISQKAQVNSLYGFICYYGFCVACLFAGQVTLQGSPCQTQSLGKCSIFMHLELCMSVMHTEEL